MPIQPMVQGGGRGALSLVGNRKREPAELRIAIDHRHVPWPQRHGDEPAYPPDRQQREQQGSGQREDRDHAGYRTYQAGALQTGLDARRFAIQKRGREVHTFAGVMQRDGLRSGRPPGQQQPDHDPAFFQLEAHPARPSSSACRDIGELRGPRHFGTVANAVGFSPSRWRTFSQRSAFQHTSVIAVAPAAPSIP